MRCRRPIGGQRVGRERDVDAVLLEARVELGASELAPAGFDRRLDRLPGLVGRLPRGRPLLRGQLGHPAQQVRELGLAAQEADPHLLEGLGARRRRRSASSASDSIWAMRSVAAHQRAILVTS